MINPNEKCDINWESTSENIRTIIKTLAPVRVIAESFNVSERTINNWCSGKCKPSIYNINLLAISSGKQLSDVLVFNYQLHPISKKDLEDYQMLAAKSDQDRHNRNYHQFESAKDLNANILNNIYHNQELPIKTLEDFLLSLPLFEIHRLCDTLFRIHGQIGVNRTYVWEKLKDLYNTIEDDEAKEYVEMWKELNLEFPPIASIDDQTQMTIKQKKLTEYWDFYDSGKYSRLSRKYEKKLSEFMANIQFLEDIKIKLSYEEQMRNKNE